MILIDIYDWLKLYFDNRVYVNKFDQSVNLQSTESNVLVHKINTNPTKQKDSGIYDVSTVIIEFIGGSYENVVTDSEVIRSGIETLRSSNIYRIEYEGMEYFSDSDSGTERISMTIIVHEKNCN